MKHVMTKTIKYCRWCGRSYTAAKPTDKDGFHSAACKQAHYRAYKKYVTATDQVRSSKAGSRHDIM